VIPICAQVPLGTLIPGRPLRRARALARIVAPLPAPAVTVALRAPIAALSLTAPVVAQELRSRAVSRAAESAVALLAQWSSASGVGTAGRLLPLAVSRIGVGLSSRPARPGFGHIAVGRRQRVGPDRAEFAEPFLGTRLMAVLVGALVGGLPAKFHLCRHFPQQATTASTERTSRIRRSHR
jgi:hypothetical protein